MYNSQNLDFLSLKNVTRNKILHIWVDFQLMSFFSIYESLKVKDMRPNEKYIYKLINLKKTGLILLLFLEIIYIKSYFI